MTGEKNKDDSGGLTDSWRAEERRKRVSRIIRWSLGLPLVSTYFFFGPIAMSFVILGAILLSFDLSSYLSGLFMHMIYPSRQAEAKPMYGIPESLVAKGLYEEAEQEYEKIIRDFPGAVKPHIDMINIAIVRMNDMELAEKLFQRGMSLVKDPSGRDTLAEAYKSVCTLIKSSASISSTSISAEKIKASKERAEQDRKKMWR